MENRENHNITITIKYGKFIKDAKFNVFYANGLIMCLSMWIGKDKIEPESRKTKGAKPGRWLARASSPPTQANGAPPRGSLSVLQRS